MKKTLNLILIMILAFSSLKANCAVFDGDQIKSIIARQVAQNDAKYTDADLSVDVVALPFKDLTLPNGKVSITVTPTANKFMSRDLEKVAIYVNNKLIKSFNAPVIVKAYKEVLIASSFISRENTINENVVRTERREISNNLEYALGPEAINRNIVAKKFFSEGELIDKRFIKLRPDVIRNATVTVEFNTNNLTVTTDAKALSDGIIGDSICIINKNYNKVYTGKVVGENRVLVKI